MSLQDYNPAFPTKFSNSSASVPERAAARAPRRLLAAAIAIVLAITGSALAAAVPASANTVSVVKLWKLMQKPILVGLPNAQVGRQYSYQIPSDGDVVQDFLRAKLPAGLTSTSGGLITGVPTLQGKYEFATYGKFPSGKSQNYANFLNVDWPIYQRFAPLTLNAGEFLQLSKKKLIMQTDGNFVMYNEQGAVVFASGTDQNTNGNRVTFQPDCNVVIYDTNNKAVWASRTVRADNSCSGGMVQVGDTARLYDGTPSHAVAWDSIMGGSKI